MHLPGYLSEAQGGLSNLDRRHCKFALRLVEVRKPVLLIGLEYVVRVKVFVKEMLFGSVAVSKLQSKAVEVEYK